MRDARGPPRTAPSRNENSCSLQPSSVVTHHVAIADISIIRPAARNSPNNLSTLLVANVRDDVKVGRPKLGLTLPIYERRERRSDEKRTL